ncbi:MAG: hypothetical protein V1844_11470 [Pseudomonadota bacterium]
MKTRRTPELSMESLSPTKSRRTCQASTPKSAGYLPNRMGNFASYLTAKAEGLADVSAALVNALVDQIVVEQTDGIK